MPQLALFFDNAILCRLTVEREMQKRKQIKASCKQNRLSSHVLCSSGPRTWGDEELGGNSFGLDLDLQNVTQLCGNGYAFAAVRRDGRVITWGDPNAGGDSSSVLTQLTDVRQVFSTYRAFAAVKDRGAVVTWGDPACGGESSSVHAALSQGVASICGTYGSFAAVKKDGTVVTWGDAKTGGDSSSVQPVFVPDSDG
eukprot:s304_g40.t1